MRNRRLLLFVLGILILLCPLSACQTATPAATPVPTAPVTPTPAVPVLLPTLPPLTQAPTATAMETATASSEWQTSADGHIMFIEKDLFAGLFTMNTENNGEYTRKYWEDIIRGLWNLNNISGNNVFIGKFPTDQSLIDYLENGGGPVDNLWIPVKYPKVGPQFDFRATMEPVDGQVDLSHLALGIDKPMWQEKHDNTASKTQFMNFGFYNRLLIEKVSIGDNIKILRFRFRNMVMKDTKYSMDDGPVTALALSDDNLVKTADEDLLAALQLIRLWPLCMQKMADRPIKDVWTTVNVNPPLLNLPAGIIDSSSAEINAITTLNGSPLAIR